jgi:YggT family protein
MASMMAFWLIDTLFTCYVVMLSIAIISSWFPEVQDNTIIRFVHFYTDPYLAFFRRLIPPLGFVDFSPIIAFIALRIIAAFLKVLFL